MGSTINTFADGSMLSSNINANLQTVWELSYTDLTLQDQSALQNHFAACQGPLRPFIFVDPTDNMLSSSSDLTGATWIADSLLSVTGGAVDPMSGVTAFTIVNNGQANQQLSQQLSAPANFQYCFSLYACAPVPSSLGLTLSATSSEVQSFSVGTRWVRLVSPVQLSDAQMTFTVSISVPPSQTVCIWGPQLEPQPRPSRYRATSGSGGVYQNAHLLNESITFESHAPGLFSTLISIETT
jgi:hypothetical protein